MAKGRFDISGTLDNPRSIGDWEIQREQSTLLTHQVKTGWRKRDELTYNIFAHVNFKTAGIIDDQAKRLDVNHALFHSVFTEKLWNSEEYIDLIVDIIKKVRRDPRIKNAAIRTRIEREIAERKTYRTWHTECQFCTKNIEYRAIDHHEAHCPLNPNLQEKLRNKPIIIKEQEKNKCCPLCTFHSIDRKKTAKHRQSCELWREYEKNNTKTVNAKHEQELKNNGWKKFEENSQKHIEDPMDAFKDLMSEDAKS